MFLYSFTYNFLFCCKSLNAKRTFQNFAQFIYLFGLKSLKEFFSCYYVFLSLENYKIVFNCYIYSLYFQCNKGAFLDTYFMNTLYIYEIRRTLIIKITINKLSLLAKTFWIFNDIYSFSDLLPLLCWYYLEKKVLFGILFE